MPFNMGMMLTNDEHIKPLLHYYLGELKPQLASKAALNEADWEYVQSPDNNIASFRLDVVAGGRSGSMNIRDGYLRALALCLQNDTTPDRIRIVSIINHHQLHWTCSVTKIDIDPDFIDKLKTALKDHDIKNMPTFRVVNLINAFLHPGKSGAQVEDNLVLFGTNKVNILHYDSHNPDPKRYIGSYYETYRKTLDGLIQANPDKAITVAPAKCKGQKGNTCGDNSLWNGFMAGVLALNPQEEFVQVDSTALRALSEHQAPALKRVALGKDAALAEQVRTHVQENIALAKQFAQISAPTPEKPKTVLPKTKKPPKAATTPKAATLPQTAIPTKKTPPKAKREPPQIYFFEETSKKNKNMNELLHRFGEGLGTIRNHIEQKYTARKTERGIKGFFQRLNIKIGNVATKRRKHQMDQLARLIDKLQKEKTLNNNEKGIILQGLLNEIIDDITLNEPKNWYNSRLQGMCTKLSQDLVNMEIISLKNKESKNLYHVYIDEGAKSFQKAASHYISKSQRRFGKS